MESGIAIFGPRRLGRRGTPCGQINGLFCRAQVEEAVPADRMPLDNDAWALWAMGQSGTVRAVAVFYEAGRRRLWLDFLYVAPEFRRRGLATALLQQLDNHCREYGCGTLVFGTRLDNAPMQALARKYGFKPAAVTFERKMLGARQ